MKRKERQKQRSSFSKDKTAKELKMESSEKICIKILDSMNVGYVLYKIITDNKGKAIDCQFIEVNHAFEKFTGLKARSIIGKRMTKVLPGIEKSKFNWVKCFGDVALKGKEERFEQFSELLQRWYEVHAFSLKKGYFVIIFNDTSERKSSEDVLRESEERYRKLFEEALDGIALADADTGILLDCNQALADLVGRKRAELIGQHQAILHPPSNNATGFSPTFKKHLTSQEGQVLETQVLTGTGETREVEIKANLLYLQGKKVLQGIFRDITERKRAERELEEKTERLRDAQELGKIGNWQYDIDTRKIEWSDETYKLYERDIACGPPSEEEEATYYSPEQAKILREFAKRAQQTGEEFKYDLEAKLPSGKTAFFTATMRPVKNEKGRVTRLIGTVQDISERKQSEKALRASLLEKEVLLKEIHHRVKNNMQVISSLLNLQAREIKDHDVLEMFNETKNRIRSMALIHEKLYQSKDLTRIDFSEYINGLVVHLFHSHKVDTNLIRFNLEREKVFLNINTAIPCGLIINELVSNALKHAFPGQRKGEIQIRLTPVDAHKFMLLVRDNGVGLPKDLDIRKTETLGMQIVVMLIEQLAGTLELKRDKGTEFKITFRELKYKQT